MMVPNSQEKTITELFPTHMRPGNKYQPVFGVTTFSPQKHDQKKSIFSPGGSPELSLCQNVEKNMAKKIGYARGPRDRNLSKILEN